MSRWLIVPAILLATTLARPAEAQEPGRCEIVDGEIMDVLERGTPWERVVLSGNARIRCDDGVILEADTAISHSVTGQRHFIGNVVYSDSATSLDADRVDYDAERGRLHARGKIVLTDQTSGSIIRGDELEYLRETIRRPQSIAIVTGDRPHATLYRTDETSDPAAPTPPEEITLPEIDDSGSVQAPEASDTAESHPLEVDADRMELHGDNLFLAFGAVELDYGEAQAFADEVEYDQVIGRVVLTTDARVEDPAFTLFAEQIEAFLQDEELREVHAEDDAVLLAEELRTEAPILRIFMLDGEVERMVATRRIVAAGDSADDPGDGTPDDDRVEVTAEEDESSTIEDSGPRPIVITTDFWLTADSIDAHSPSQRLEEVVAVGAAYGEQIDPESETESLHLPEGAVHDWLSGDTIIAFFVEESVVDVELVSETDEVSSESRTTLERLISIGPEGRARSVYRVQEEEPDGGLSINYMVANRITLQFRDGEVGAVEAEGPLRGVHLQPESKSRDEEDPAEEASTSAESNGT